MGGETVVGNVAKERAMKRVTKEKDEQPNKKFRSNLDDNVSLGAMKETVQFKTTTTAPSDSLEAAASIHPLGKHGVSVTQSRDLLKELHKTVQHVDHKFFWSEARLKDWSKEITSELARSFPETIIGCLGSTGVGKSSTLNALLNDSILPTSGSRACTAAPCELRYNQALTNANPDGNAIYKCVITFITLEEWHAEVKMLLDDCCGVSENIEEITERRGDKANAWNKLCQAFGRDTMDSFVDKKKTEAWDDLRSISRINELLTSEIGEQPTTEIEEGVFDAAEAKTLLLPRSKWTEEMKEKCEEAAASFRDAITPFLYRSSGDDGEPQAWPLLKNAVLYGPWEVLSTGACLVDLPGAQDANVARAKVTESYMQNCHQFFIVAPIKRAVDCETAKDLFGEQFKRQLLMDGQYGNVSFICTQTDLCEPKEVMDDHQDVAKEVDGRWEEMLDIRDNIKSVSQESKSLPGQKRSLVNELRKARQAVKGKEKEIKENEETKIELRAITNEEEDDQDPEDVLNILEDELEEKKKVVVDLEAALIENKENVPKLKEKLIELQHKLKVIAAGVRNEYCTKRLQADFRSGYEELTRTTNASYSCADNIQMDVFCVSANDYQKVRGMSGWEGPPTTFTDPKDTQIPALCSWVNNITVQSRDAFATDFVSKATNLMARIQLRVLEYEERSTCEEKFHEAFQKEMKSLDFKMDSIASKFLSESKSKIEMTLRPALEGGAAKAKKAAVKTVQSWASKNHRTSDSDSQGAGMHWLTFRAALKRRGIFDSKTAGGIDLNQELYDPMEREFSYPWQQTMDEAMKEFLATSEANCLEEFERVGLAVVQAFAGMGMNPSRLQSIDQAAKDFGRYHITMIFKLIRMDARETQRKLNRAPLAKVATSMHPGYEEATIVVEGQGYFQRMVSALVEHTANVSANLFDDAATKLSDEVIVMVERFASMMNNLAGGLHLKFDNVYSVCWEKGQDVMDPEMKMQIEKCRKKLILHLNDLSKAQKESHKLIMPGEGEVVIKVAVKSEVD